MLAVTLTVCAHSAPGDTLTRGFTIMTWDVRSKEVGWNRLRIKKNALMTDQDNPDSIPCIYCRRISETGLRFA